MAIKKYGKSINLFDKGASGIVDNTYISRVTEQPVSEASYYLSAPIPVTVGQTYRWTFDITITSTFNVPTVGFFNVNDELMGVAPHLNNVKSFVFTVPDGCAYVRASVYKNTERESMLTQGDEEQTAYIPPYIWYAISYRKYGTETESITTFPKEIITDGEPIGINLLNPDSTFIESGNTYYGGTFPAGTYYIMNNDSLYDYIEVIITELGSTEVTGMAGGASDIFTTTGTITVKIQTQNTARNVLVARSSVAVPFVPYLPCTISGNLVQTGTPTPSAPIYPEECGEMSANLCYGKIQNANVGTNGLVVSHYEFNCFKAKIIPGETYTVSLGNQVVAFFEDEPSIGSYSYSRSRVVYSGENYTFVAPAGSNYVLVRAALDTDPMLNEGSTPIPYEPYGMYKLPISCGGTTTNVYLGEIQSTRRIKKLVLTGDEDWTAGASDIRYITTLAGAELQGICSHFTYGDSTENGNFDIVPARSQIRFNNSGYSTLSDFITFLRLQYANGTPVTVWYVLAEPETAVVNEPLRKIGDYADTVSATNIPTTGTPENFDIGTTLKPSEVQLTYHGWHEHEDTKYMQGE